MKFNIAKSIIPIIVVCLCCTFGSTFQKVACAEMITFDRITNNGPIDIASQFSAIVSSVDATHVQFEFHNSAAIASSITDIYFDDGGPNSPSVLSSLSSIINNTTIFQSGATPANLPSGKNTTPSFTSDFAAESANSPPTMITNGVNHLTDFVDLQFSLHSSITFNDVINALDNKSLRVGLHVQGIPITGGTTSDSFVSVSIISVPEPSTIALLGMGGIGLIAWSWRRNRKAI